MESKLYVGNLPYSTTEEDLRELFAQAGAVQSVALIKDRDSGRSKGFGFVEMGDDATGVTEETIIAASIVKVSATIRTGIMTGILGAVLLVSGSVVYWRMRRMNS